MNINEAIGRLKGIICASHTVYFKNFELMYQDVDAIETIINEYNNLKQIEEAHRIENGKLRLELNQKEKYFAKQLLYNNIIGRKDKETGKWRWYANEEDCKRLVNELIKIAEGE